MNKNIQSEIIQIFRTPEMPGEFYIRDMFDNFADRYDIFTILIGMGQDRRLRRKTLESLKPGMQVLDVACGTGDLTLLAAGKIGPKGSVVGLDFSPQMLINAQKRTEKKGLNKNENIQWVLKKAEELPLDGRRFDRIVSAYALRNLYEHMDAILSGIYASLKPMGEIAFLDLTEPVNPILRFLFRFYMYLFVGFYGLILFGKKYPVTYLPNSAGRFFKAYEFVELLKKTGFKNVRHRSFMLGAVTLYQARKVEFNR